MAEPDISEVADQLAKTTVEGEDVLSFAGKGLKLDHAGDAKEIVEAINKCEGLRALRLDGNTMGVDAAKEIGEALEKHPEFERALWSDMFTGRLKTEIPEALKYLGYGLMKCHARLVELDLSDNAFGPNGMVGLQELLKSETCYTLKELRLNNNGLGITGGRMLANCLSECHRASSAARKPLALRVFVSGRGRLENEGSAALAEVFEAMGSLEEVQMPQNGINPPGVKALAKAFAKNKNLKIINLNDNTFTAEGAKDMAMALPQLTGLEVINFGDCLIRTEGAIALAEGLKDLTRVRELNLGFNEIRYSGANEVAEAMENKEHLEKFELNGNQLGEEGIEIVRGTLDTIGKGGCLGSLSDDEGIDSDEDEGVDSGGDGEGDEEQEGEGSEGESEGEEVADPELQVRGVSITPSPRKEITVEEFLENPSATGFLSLGKERGKCLVSELGTNITNVEEVCRILFKVLNVIPADDSKLQEAAFSCSDLLLAELCRGDDDNLGSQLANSILVHLGLIKSEDKIKPVFNMNGTLRVLQHIVQQEYFPPKARDILQTFLSQPHGRLDACQAEKHQLLQALYQF